MASLHLHQFAKKNTPENYKLVIEKCDCHGGEMDCTITVKFHGDPPVNDNVSFSLPVMQLPISHIKAFPITSAEWSRLAC